MKTLTSIVAAGMVIMMTAAFSLAASPVRVEKKEGIGAYLADSNGMTLYNFKKDSAGKSACAGDCLTKWPIYLNREIAVPVGVAAGDFGVITRDDGKEQSTFRGMPLYYFFKDKNTGDTAGQGINNVWNVVTP